MVMSMLIRSVLEAEANSRAEMLTQTLRRALWLERLRLEQRRIVALAGDSRNYNAAGSAAVGSWALGTESIALDHAAQGGFREAVLKLAKEAGPGLWCILAPLMPPRRMSGAATANAFAADNSEKEDYETGCLKGHNTSRTIRESR
jgi:hypothetical protein